MVAFTNGAGVGYIVVIVHYRDMVLEDAKTKAGQNASEFETATLPT